MRRRLDGGLHAVIAQRAARARAVAAENQWLLDGCIELEARQHAARVRLGPSSATPGRKLPAFTAVAAVAGVLLSGVAALFAYVAWLDSIESMRRLSCECSNLAATFCGLAMVATVASLLTLLASRRPGAGGRGRVLLRRITMGACAAAGVSLLALLLLT